MICAPIFSISPINATAKPIDSPKAASTAIASSIVPICVGKASIWGQNGMSAIVIATAATTRGISVPVVIPGSGTRTNAPAILERTKRNA